MEVVLLAAGAVVLAYLLQPLIATEITPVWDRVAWLPDAKDQSGDRTTARPADAPRDRLAIADGGRTCYNCGARIDDEFRYCGECLTPVV